MTTGNFIGAIHEQAPFDRQDMAPPEPNNAHDRKHYYEGAAAMMIFQKMERYYRQRAAALQDRLREFMSQDEIDKALRDRGIEP